MIQIGRKMPKNCLRCSAEHLYITFYYCAITGYITNDVRLNKRHPECPLVEVSDNNIGNMGRAFAKAHECCGGCVE